MRHLRTIRIGTLLLAAAGAPAVSVAEGLTWFGETSFSGAYPVESMEYRRAATLAREDDALGLRALLAPAPARRELDTEALFDPLFQGMESSRLDQGMRSEVGLSLGGETVSVPVYRREAVFIDGRRQELSGFGVKWRHEFSGLGSLTVATRYGKGAYTAHDELLAADTANMLTSVSWTSQIGERGSSITGSVFYGDEQAEDLAYKDLGRRVYGFVVGGQWAVTRHHLPFVALQYQANDATATSLLDDSTRIAAGWNWAVTRDWHVKAEASFGYNDPRLNLFDIDSKKFQFSTRFDIK
jgi:hypothetical protein